jgi:hypothetical protein
MSDNIIPVFSGGVGRSGTTIVGRILKNHSNVFAGSPFEVKFITETNGFIDLVFGQRKFLKTQISRRGLLLSKLSKHDPIKLRFMKFRRRIYEDWWIRTNRLGRASGLHRALGIDQMEELLDELGSSLNSPIEAARNFVFGYVRNHNKWQGENLWMDTTPANIMYADFIYRIFPEAKFIEMRRNALDNISSVLKEPWGPNDPDKAIIWWRDRISLASAAKQLIDENHFLTLFLEDLVQNNRKNCYLKLISFLKLVDEQEMSRYFDTEVTVEKAHFGRWKKDFANPDAFKSRFEFLSSQKNSN